MKVDMIDLLVRQPTVVLQHVVVLGARGLRDVLRHLQDLEQLVVGDVGELGAVVLRDDELRPSCQRERACAKESGLGSYRVPAA